MATPPVNPIHDFLMAAQAGDQQKVLQHLNKGMDIETRYDVTGDTALTFAADAGKLNMVELLAMRGADLNAANGDGNTALHEAVWRKNIPIVRFLLQQRPNVDAQNHAGLTPLMVAICGGSIEVVKLLLENNADPRLSDPNRFYKGERGFSTMDYAREHAGMRASGIEIMKMVGARLIALKQQKPTSPDRGDAKKAGDSALPPPDDDEKPKRRPS